VCVFDAPRVVVSEAVKNSMRIVTFKETSNGQRNLVSGVTFLPQVNHQEGTWPPAKRELSPGSSKHRYVRHADRRSRDSPD